VFPEAASRTPRGDFHAAVPDLKALERINGTSWATLPSWTLQDLMKHLHLFRQDQTRPVRESTSPTPNSARSPPSDTAGGCICHEAVSPICNSAANAAHTSIGSVAFRKISSTAGLNRLLRCSP
jgi:hypothetical protein